MRVRAIDESGNGVAGLRVRLRFLWQLYPDMPKETVSVVSCGLAALGEDTVTYNSAPQMDGTKPEDYTEACITDADGYAYLSLTFTDSPLVDALEASNYTVPAIPDYLSSAPTGALFMDYEAIRLDATGPTPVFTTECYSDPIRPNVLSDAYTVRVAGAASSTADGDFLVLGPNEVKEAAGSEAPTGVGQAYKPPYPFIAADGTSVPLEIAAPIEADPTGVEVMVLHGAERHTLTVHNSSGAAVAFKASRLRWVQTPWYAVGYQSRLEGCLSTYWVKQVYPDVSGYFSNCRDIFMRQSIIDYGLTVAVLNDAYAPMARHPYQPRTAVLVTNTDAAGAGSLQLQVSKGEPGLYGFVMVTDGATSEPVFFVIPSALASMAILQEPSRTSDSTPAGLAVTDVLLPTEGGGWKWPVGVSLNKPLILRMLDASGAPLLGYKAFVRAVDDQTGEPLPSLSVRVEVAVHTLPVARTVPTHPTTHSRSQPPLPLPSQVLFDVAGDAPFSSGSSRSTPADATGRSIFTELTLIDAVNNTCFRLQAFFQPFTASEAAKLAALGRADISTDEVRVTSTVRFCAVNNRLMHLAGQPSTTTVLGTRFVQPPTVRAEWPLERIATPGQEDLFYVPQVRAGARSPSDRPRPSSAG